MADPPPTGEATTGRSGGGSERSLRDALCRRDAAARAAHRRAREPAVYAYCARVCSLEAIPAAVEASFGAFFAQGEGLREDGADLDQLLLGATRAEAAERAPRPAGAPGGRGARVRHRLAGLLGEPSPAAVCAVMPRLLAARAAGLLRTGEAERLRRHLKRCTACRGAEDRLERAERAFEDRARDVPLGSIWDGTGR